jgi:hypothetical protein
VSAVIAIIALNGAWVIASLALVVTSVLGLTSVGSAVIVAQAIAVAVIADVVWLGLRRARRQPA